MARDVIHMAAAMTGNQNPQLFWKHIVGLAQLEMRQRGWSGGTFLDASWKDGALAIWIGHGAGKIDVDALQRFFQAKKQKGKSA